MADKIKEVANISVTVGEPRHYNPDHDIPGHGRSGRCEVLKSGRGWCEGSPVCLIRLDGNGCEDTIVKFLCEKHIAQLRHYIDQNLRVGADVKRDDGRWQPISTLHRERVIAQDHGRTFDLWVEQPVPNYHNGIWARREVDCGIDEQGKFYCIDDDGDARVFDEATVTHWIRVGSPQEVV